ncbi:hypothetical protein KR093_010978 [Drosophila rubida]|uniref:Uncharacterized protein n=1 Tax=Drosophila rubida TaxID=30044 RepID=A0AAD4K2B6_9MUSC|nr:hypothetical protein KR093_010978 [Drosophila rubida]
MDNFQVPTDVNVSVLKAIAELQHTDSDSFFVHEDKICARVTISNTQLDKVFWVGQSLNSLTLLGILVRSGTSTYALRQNLEFAPGISAIPWNIPSQQSLKRKRTGKMPEKKSKIMKKMEVVKPPNQLQPDADANQNKPIGKSRKELNMNARKYEAEIKKSISCARVESMFATCFAKYKNTKNKAPVNSEPEAPIMVDSTAGGDANNKDLPINTLFKNQNFTRWQFNAPIVI